MIKVSESVLDYYINSIEKMYRECSKLLREIRNGDSSG